MCDKCKCTCCDHGCTCESRKKGNKAVTALAATGLTAGVAAGAYFAAKKLGLLDETIV